MNYIQRKLLWAGFVAYLSVPALSYAAPGELADQPLWLSKSVKHNLLFIIDDSGSMDWELSFPVKDGTPFLNNQGNFVASDGTLYTSGQQYAYAFGNGVDGTYDGRRMYSNRYAIPPIPQYASARSAAYNNAYYDPSITYNPWPEITAYTTDLFGQASVTATKVEPVSSAFGTRTVNLFTVMDTSTNGWYFDIRDSDMVCEADGRSTCGVGGKNYSFYPATYYLADRTGQYYYDPEFNGANPPKASNSKLVEAESANLNGLLKNSIGLETATSGNERSRVRDARSGAGGSDFIGTKVDTGENSFGSPPSNSESNARYTVEMPTSGVFNVWIRNRGFSSASDSVWASLSSEGGTGINISGNVTLSNNGTTNPVGRWGAMRENTSRSGSWEWTKWGSVNLDQKKYRFELRHRETGFFIDQILFTKSPEQPFGNSPIVDTKGLKECADSTAADYLEFARFPARFRKDGSASSEQVDAFGFDGACMTKYEIGRNQADGDDFTNGAGVARKVLDEKKNFANWFKYYRRRHQAMRGGLASAVQGISGINGGMTWLNKNDNIMPSGMHDLGSDAGMSAFLSAHYKQVRTGGTYLRSGLNRVRNNLKRTIDPLVTSECQKNYTLLFTDGFNTETGGVSGIGNEDSAAGKPYRDNYSDTLGDIAYNGYASNLRSTLPEGQVSIPAECGSAQEEKWMDCNRNLHMNTYTVGLGLSGNIFGKTHFNVKDAHDNPPTWPNAGQQGLNQIDDLYHAAVNGRGEMFSAQSPDQLGKVLTEAIDEITNSIGSGSGVAFNASNLQAEDGTALYSTLFNPTKWSGDVSGILLDASGDPISPAWKDSKGNFAGAAAILDERDLTDPNEARTILTYNPGADGIGFTWNELSAAQKNDLRTEPNDNGTPSGDEATGIERLEFIRGDRSNEGAKFRARSSRMADVINSTPVYVGKPLSNWPNDGVFGVTGNRYEDFRDKTFDNGGASDRTPALYVGANGGMLHGFNAQNTGTNGGDEILGYIPSALFSTSVGKGLHYLTDPNYSHQAYVDLSPVVQDVFTTVDGSNDADWRTMLVGGMRSGAKGLFALDVTNPLAFSEAAAGAEGADEVAASKTVMWEFTAADDNNLGYLSTPPTIAMLNNDQWAVVFGNGYESVNGRAALMILFVEGGLDGSWAATDKLVIDTEAGTSGSKNGLSGVNLVDLNGDRIPDRVYGGDLEGNMWAFDISDDDPANWKVANKRASGSAPSGFEPAPLFKAEYGGKAQPITAAPIIAYHAEQSTSGFSPNVLVAFGTGQYLVNGDQSNTDVQSFYTIWDKGTGDLDRNDLALRALTRTDEGIRQTTGTPVNWINNEGWSIDFTVTGWEGERMVQKPVLLLDSVVGPIALYATQTPNSSSCSGGIDSVLYATPLFSGLNPDKPILDLNSDGDFDNKDSGVGKELKFAINDLTVLANRYFASLRDQSSVDGDTSGTAAFVSEIVNTELESKRLGRVGWNEMQDE